MPKSALTAAVSKRDLDALKRALKVHRGPIPGQAVVGAGGAAWKQGLALLNKHGADLNASYRNYRALHSLIQAELHEGVSSTPERTECLEWLLAHGADPDGTGAWPQMRAIIVAAFTGGIAYVRALKAAGARMDIFAAAALGEAKKVATFLRRNPNVARTRDEGGVTALMCCCGSRLGRQNAAIARGLTEAARVLVDAGADVNATVRSYAHDVTVSYFVISSVQIETLKVLLSRGLDATIAIAPAARDGREDIVDLLIASGGRVNEAFDHTKPVLNELVRWGQFKQARMMLARGASPNIADERGWTAIHQAVSRGNVNMLKDLMQAGGDATIEDHAGKTPKDLAKLGGKGELVRILYGA